MELIELSRVAANLDHRFAELDVASMDFDERKAALTMIEDLRGVLDAAESALVQRLILLGAA